jgi:molybdopterin/thiamine biosynthesis adenylyltransferase/rhodanese-related sulfurtransferase
MNPDFLRYGCQIALPGFSDGVQTLLQQAKVLIVGIGGLGCPAAQYLAGAGIGTLAIADYDIVSTGNLHRQILYTPADVGSKKVAIAAKRLQQQNPGIEIIPIDVKVSSANVIDVITPYDIIVDGTDNFETRYLLNDACVLIGKPLVYGAIYQFEGQVAVWNITTNVNGAKTPNYRDIYPQVDATQIPNCADGGVIPTLAGIIGCIQANEVIKYITQTGELLAGKMLIFDASTLQSRIIKIGNTTNTNITSLTTTIDVQEINVADLKKGLAADTFELVDIRTDQERDEIDIGGTHIEMDELEDNLEYLNSGKIKVFYCSSGKRSGEAVKLLKQKHPDLTIFSLTGGLKAWFENKD